MVKYTAGIIVSAPENFMVKDSVGILVTKFLSCDTSDGILKGLLIESDRSQTQVKQLKEEVSDVKDNK